MPGSSEFKGVKKILVMKFRHIGDVLLIVPVIRALKETFPDASVTVLVNRGTEDVLAGNPLIDELVTLERRVKELSVVERYINEIRFIKKIRSKGFDMTVDLTGGDRAAILSCVSGAGYRLGWKSGKGFIGKKYCHTHPVAPQSGRHMVLQNLEIVNQYGIDTADLSVDFQIPEKERLAIKETLREYNIREDDTIVHIHPTSKWLFKCWKDEYMAEIIAWIVGQGMKVVLTSAPEKNEIEKVKKILSLIPGLQAADPGIIDLSGKTSIKGLAAISEISDLFIGVDSAPMHIAAAVKTPVIALFGPTDENIWGPYGMDHVVIAKNLPCKPCKKGMCEGIQLRECMRAIKPDDVKEAVSLRAREKIT